MESDSASALVPGPEGTEEDAGRDKAGLGKSPALLQVPKLSSPKPPKLQNLQPKRAAESCLGLVWLKRLGRVLSWW